MSEKLNKCCVAASARIVDALRTIEEGRVGIALAVDATGRLDGTLTDGDLRRALLGGAPLDGPLGPHVKRNFTSVGPRAGRVEVLELMKARWIDHVPVIDSTGKLIGLHLLHDVIKETQRPNWAVIMAGGRGMRLRPITERIPKPMLSVAGRPILERLILHLTGFGFHNVFLAVNYLGQMIEDHFGDGKRFGCSITYLREEQSLGTAGALSLLPAPASDPILIMNGDLVTQANVGALMSFHANGGQVATIGVRRYFHTIPFGCIDLTDDKVTGMIEKPEITRFVNAGIYVLSPEVVSRVPRGQVTDMPTLLEKTMGRDECVRAFEIEDDWIDVGQHEHLAKAREGTSE